MKKYTLILIIVYLLFTLIGCGAKDTTEPVEENNVTPTTKPEQTIPTDVPKEDETIADYYPFLENVEYIYEGIGNEYAAYRKTIDYVNEDKNRVQTRVDNGGTEVVSVVENKNGKLAVLTSIGESYYRDDLTEIDYSDQEAEILLMKPLEKGTEWILPDGRKRYISAVEVTVDTPAGSYTAIEVTTEGEDSETKDYYVRNIGLVKTVFRANDYEVTSSLSEVKTNAVFERFVEFYYPNVDETINTEQKILEYRTNDQSAILFEEAMKEEGDREGSLALINENTKINSLYLGKDNTVYVDFSEELIKDMNAGAGYELLILQSIVNTFGTYYGVEEVLITVDKKPYESGHIMLNDGETLKVNKEPLIQ